MNLLTLFFVIDHSHSKKRIHAFKKNVENLTIVSYYRNDSISYENHYSLGKIPQNKYLLRFSKIIFDIPRLLKFLSNNPNIDVVYAWNFDIALLFIITKMFTKRQYKFVYEVADIKSILLSNSIWGKILRKFEQFILSNTDYLCVTSEDYISNYFNKYYSYQSKIHILENKVYPKINYKFKNDEIRELPDKLKWKIGLVGIFRCNTSLHLLTNLAESLPNKVEIILAGKYEQHSEKAFKKLACLDNINIIGEYQYPDDLLNIYSKIDIIWSADFSDPSDNSKWLLPNRIYEAGLFSVPQLCFSENKAISNYIKSLNIGWVIAEANIENLLHFISLLTIKQYQQIKFNYVNLPTNQFSGDDQIKALLNDVKSELQYEKYN